MIQSILELANTLEYVGAGLDAIVWRMVQHDGSVRIIRCAITQHTVVDQAKIDIFNEYRKRASLFVRTYQAFIQDELPLELMPPNVQKVRSILLRQNLEYIVRGERFDFSVRYDIMEDAGIEIALKPYSKVIDLDDVRCLLFDFLFGLLTARIISGSFGHNDIHERNVTISKTRNIVERRLYVGDREFVLSSQYRLHLIDYDRATWPKENYHVVTDVNSGLNVLRKYAEQNVLTNFLTREDPLHGFFRQMQFADATQPLIEVLTRHPIFQTLWVRGERKRLKRQERVDACVQCFGRAAYVAKGLGIHFCGNECNRQYHFI